MDLELKGKVALVTGGSKGIGRVVAEELALEGADVAICARTRDTLEATAKELARSTGRRIVPIVADTSDTAYSANRAQNRSESEKASGNGSVDSVSRSTASAAWTTNEGASINVVPADVMKSGTRSRTRAVFNADTSRTSRAHSANKSRSSSAPRRDRDKSKTRDSG